MNERVGYVLVGLFVMLLVLSLSFPPRKMEKVPQVLPASMTMEARPVKYDGESMWDSPRWEIKEDNGEYSVWIRETHWKWVKIATVADVDIQVHQKGWEATKE